jgi:hypothetical protein
LQSTAAHFLCIASLALAGIARGSDGQHEQQPGLVTMTQSASAAHEARAPLGVFAGGSSDFPHAAMATNDAMHATEKWVFIDSPRFMGLSGG